MKKPLVRTVAGKDHQLVLLKVLGRDNLGRPKEALVLYDENVEHLQGGEEYVTAWVPTVVIAKERVS